MSRAFRWCITAIIFTTLVVVAGTVIPGLEVVVNVFAGAYAVMTVLSLLLGFIAEVGVRLTDSDPPESHRENPFANLSVPYWVDVIFDLLLLALLGFFGLLWAAGAYALGFFCQATYFRFRQGLYEERSNAASVT